MKGKRRKQLQRQVEGVELRRRARAAALQGAAHRNEKLRALKAAALRSEMTRLQGYAHLTPGNQHIAAAQDQLKKHLRELAQ